MKAETWKFLELWVDPILFPPKVLMLVGDADGACRIFNPPLTTNSSSPTPTTKPPKIGSSKTNTIASKANSSPKKFSSDSNSKFKQASNPTTVNNSLIAYQIP
jgi:hypothetical protein